jgi:tetratricopeptide (TPR) repeat protein
MSRLAALLLALALAAAARASETPPVDLGALAAAHPDDPNLAWAHARALVAEERHAEAAAALAALRARWPQRFPEAAWLHGRALLHAGEPQAALAVVDAARVEQPDDEALVLLRAAILLRLERHAEAQEGLERAAARDPSLAALADELRATRSHERHDARRTRPAPVDPARRLALEIYTGTEWDSNANVDNSAIPGPRVSDWRIVSGAGLTWRALRREAWQVDLEYRYDREDPIELEDLARDRHLAELSLVRLVSDRLALLLEAEFAATRLDRDWYHSGWRVEPGALFAFGRRAGWLRAWAELGQDDYHDEPRLSSLERDADVYGAALEHVLPVPGWRGGFASLRLDGSRNDTGAEQDPFGFDGAYDHDAVGVRLRLRGPLAFGVSLDAVGGWEGARYDHGNVLAALSELDASPVRRRDDVLWSRVSLVRPVHRLVQLELSWRHHDRSSNVALYDVESDTVGCYFTFTPSR